MELEAVRRALSEWQWLIGSSYEPILVSTAGDVFLRGADGHVAWLDTGSGETTRIAESEADFEAKLRDAALVEDWFLTPVVDDFRASGKELAPGQCLGFTIPPIFAEGSYAAGNRFALSAVEHIALTGSLHRQLSDVPDGEQVTIVVED